MFRNYKCLSKQEFSWGRFKIVPIRHDDRFEIMKWRNVQINVLRQREPLTRAQQDHYFQNVISALFEAQNPDQILFSFIEDDTLAGYGGLVHIDWVSKNAEISFLTNPNRNKDPNVFIQDWKTFLTILKPLVKSELGFNKIYTYAYDIRPHLYQALTQSFFKEEARLKKHVLVGGLLTDIVIHSYFFNDLSLRKAEQKDLMLYFNWANDGLVRANSFNQIPIELEDHTKWFTNKIDSSTAVLFVATQSEGPVGQIRFIQDSHGDYEIGFSVDAAHRGKGLGQDLIRRGTEEFFSTNPSARRVIAKVKANNVPSMKSFEKIGFRRIVDADQEGVCTFLFENI